MSADVERLEAELALAKLSEKLEDAREQMHENRTPARIAKYQEASNAVATARAAFREKWQVVVEEGDAAPAPATVRVKARGPE